MVTVIKRDGTLVDFDISKIINAILKASKSVHEIPSSAIEIMAKSVENKVKNHDKISVANNEITRLINARERLLPKLMSGEVEV